MGTMNLIPASVADYRRIAESRLPRFLFDYIDGGAYDEVTLRKNVSDFGKLAPIQKVMCDVSQLDKSLTLAGTPSSLPLALAPIGMGGMFARRAEVQAKRAADKAGVPFTLSTVSICSIEEIAAVSDIPCWFQLYMLRDRGIVQELLERAWQTGVKTLVFTVDLAVVGERYRDVRNGIAGDASTWARLRSGPLSYVCHPRWLMDVGIKGKPHTFGNLATYVPNARNPVDFRAWVGSQFDASVTWKDIEWLRTTWKGTLLIKGVLTPGDALAAADTGSDGVIVSNHGGRQLDGVASSISVLPEICNALEGRVEVLMDCGVRSGLDIFRAKALGANGVLIGRPWAYAVAAQGEDGVSKLLSSFDQGLSVAMALSGVASATDINRDLVSFAEDCNFIAPLEC